MKETIIVTIILGILLYNFFEELLAVLMESIHLDMVGLFWLSYLLALLGIFIRYIQEKCFKKKFISLLSLFTIMFIGLGKMIDIEWWWTIISILGLFIYIFTKKYYWWLIFSPAITMGLMYILEEFYPCLKPVGLGACG